MTAFFLLRCLVFHNSDTLYLLNSTSCFRTCLTQGSSEGNNRPTSNEIETENALKLKIQNVVLILVKNRKKEKKHENANLEHQLREETYM